MLLQPELLGPHRSQLVMALHRSWLVLHMCKWLELEPVPPPVPHRSLPALPMWSTWLVPLPMLVSHRSLLVLPRWLTWLVPLP